MSGPGSVQKANAGRNRKQRQTAARWACASWIVSGLYLFASTPAASFLSIKALLFFVVGTFAASLTIGLASGLVERSMLWLAMKLLRGQGRTAAAALASAISQLVVIIEVCLAFLAARLVFHSMA